MITSSTFNPTALQFDILEKYKKKSKERIDLFWSHIYGGGEGVGLLGMTLLLTPFILFTTGLSAFIEKIYKHLPLHFFTFDRFINILLPSNLLILDLFSWIIYFILTGGLTIACFKTLNRLSHIQLEENTWNLREKFTCAETTIFASLKISEELEGYSKSPIPSDWGLGADLDWIGAKFYGVLIGRRHFGQYSGPNTISNSYFFQLEDKEDAIKRIDLLSWYPKEGVMKDKVIDKLFELRDLIFRHGFWHDYSLGVIVYRSLAQTFVAVNDKNMEMFKTNLENTLILYRRYSKTRRPLKGLPYYTSLLAPKVIICLIGFIFLLVVSLILLFLPGWLVSVIETKVAIRIEQSFMREMVQMFLVVLGLFMAILPFMPKNKPGTVRRTKNN